jgi:hemerythrin
MVLIEWKDRYSLGIPEVDYEHRELIKLINVLLLQISECDASPEIVISLGEVYARIAMHFALEEKIMRKKNYDQLEQHKSDHERLLNDIRNIMDEYEDSAKIDTEDFANRLSDWFGTHFQTMDARLHKHLGI